MNTIVGQQKNLKRVFATVAAIAAAHVAAPRSTPMPALMVSRAEAQSIRPPSVSSAPARGGLTPADQVVNKVRFDQLLEAQMPLDMKFKDETGKTVKLGQYYGERPVVTALIFYNCTMLCNEVLNEAMRGFKELQFNVGKDFDVVVVSIDPKETPDLALGKKQTYVKEYNRPGTEQGWHFLVADKQGDDTNIKKLASTIGYHYTPDPNLGFAHPAGLVISTPEGKVARYLLNFPYEARDLRFGLVEAGNNKIGSIVDQIAMLCFHYNPAVGKYTVSIMNIVRLAFCAMVVLIGTFLVVMVRRDQKQNAQWKVSGMDATTHGPA